MKQCPFCAEEIQDEAVVYRYCTRSLFPEKTTLNWGLLIIFAFGIVVGVGILYSLGFLGTVLVPVIEEKVVESVGRSRAGIAKLQLDQLEGALGLFRFEVGRYPTTSEGLDALVRNPGVPDWAGPYLDKMTIPKDPWNCEYEPC